MVKFSAPPFEQILLEALEDMIFIVKVGENKSLTYSFINHAAFSKGSLKPAAIGCGFFEVHDEKTATLLQTQYAKVLETGQEVIFDDEYTLPDGQKVFSHTRLFPLHREHGEFDFIVGIVKDFSKQKIAQIESQENWLLMKESEEKFRIITENAHEIIVFLDQEGVATYVSPSIKEAGAFSPKIQVGKPFAEYIHPADIPELQHAFLRSITNAVKFTVQLRVLNSLNHWLWIELNATPIYTNEKQFSKMMTISRDITLQKEYEGKLEYFAFHDSLSGLPNRRFFKKALAQKLAQQQPEKQLAVVLLDIDFFKDINDRFGHEAGDGVIEEFGKRLQSGIGSTDIAARLGGDEFVLLLTIESQEHLLETIRSIQKEIDRPWHIENTELSVGSSMGIACLSKTATHDISAILKTADDAMYAAKKAGRNRYSISSL